MSPRRKFVHLAILALAALTFRLAAIWLIGAYRAAEGTTYEHGEIAENLLKGQGFSVWFLGTSGATSQQAPFYPGLLAAVYYFFGIGTAASLLAMQVLQAVAGTWLAVCVVWLCWSLLTERPALGLAAGWIAALDPTHLYMVTHFQTALWSALVLTTLLAWVAWPVGRHSWTKALFAGLLAGWLALIDPILALALPFAAWLFWRGDRDLVVAGGWLGEFWSRCGRALRLATIGLAATAVVAPWLYRNYRVHGELVFVKSTFGYAFWQGNNPASWGTDKIPKTNDEVLRNEHDGTLAGRHQALWNARHETLYIDDVLLKPTGYRDFEGLSEPARSRLLGRQAAQFVAAHPGQYLRLCLRRLRYFLWVDETNPKARNGLYRLTTIAWLASVCLGMVLLRARWRTLWPLAGIFASVTLFHAFTITSARFRIPVEPLTFVWAAASLALLSRGIEAALNTLSASSSQRLPVKSPFSIPKTLTKVSSVAIPIGWLSVKWRRFPSPPRSSEGVADVPRFASSEKLGN